MTSMFFILMVALTVSMAPCDSLEVCNAEKLDLCTTSTDTRVELEADEDVIAFSLLQTKQYLSADAVPVSAKQDPTDEATNRPQLGRRYADLEQQVERVEDTGSIRYSGRMGLMDNMTMVKKFGHSYNYSEAMGQQESLLGIYPLAARSTFSSLGQLTAPARERQFQTKPVLGNANLHERTLGRRELGKHRPLESEVVLVQVAQNSYFLTGGLIVVVAYLFFIVCFVNPARGNETDNSIRQAVVPCMCWTSFSILLSIFNKWVMTPKGGDFAYPVTMCTMHMITTTSALWIMRFAKPGLFPGLVAFRSEIIPVLVLPVFGIGLVGAFSLALSNFSVKTLSVAFINLLKTANPAFALLLAAILGTMDSKGPMKQISLAVLFMILGASITCAGELSFSAIGLACFIGGVLAEQFRLIMLKKMLSGNELQWDPLSTLAVISPVAFIILLVPAILIDGPNLPYDRLSSDHRLQQALLLNSLTAVALNVSYVRLLDVISPVTFTVCGVCKDLVTAVTSLHIVGGAITPVQYVGYAVTLAGFTYYDYCKSAVKPVGK